MDAFHTIWTEPARMKDVYGMPDYEILVMIISALNWRKYNGNITLYADDYALEYLEELKLLDLWNDIRPFAVSDINPVQFWAAGKISALSLQNTPAVMLDTDLIVWNDITEELLKKDITVMHLEEINYVYPDISNFEMKNGYSFNPNWSLKVKPCNTALLFIKDNDFKNYYVSESLRFMENRITDESDFLYSMVFAEQRLLSMCANEKSKSVNAILDHNDLDNQKSFTHLWGYKRTLESAPAERHNFCKRCLNRIKEDFPEFYDVAEYLVS